MSRDYALLTGFEPFGGDLENPSQQIARAVDGEVVRGIAVKSAVLPVEIGRLPAALDDLLKEPPVAVIHLGLAAGRCAVSVERVAINVLDFSIPDNAGRMERDAEVVPGGPAAYMTRLSLRASVERLRSEGIPAYISGTAGEYLCNACMYLTLHRLAERDLTVPAGFMHVPYTTEQAARMEQPRPSLPLEMLTRASCLLLDVALAEADAR